MRRLLAAVVVSSLALLGGAAGARSASRAYSGHLGLWVKGWGTVELKAGLAEHGPFKCLGVFCTTHDALRLNRSPVVLAETPYKGWKFTGWWGACTDKKPKCVINLAHIRPNADGKLALHVGAKYVPVAAGFTRGHPIPLGTTASIGRSLRLRINSVRQNVQLSPAPPAGAEYVAANVTLTYGQGSAPYATGHSALGDWPVIGSHNRTYTLGPNSCPSAPQPQLALDSPIHRGQSESGYVCWTIATNDAGTLELYSGTGGPHPGRTIWFALH
ncbi:MAG TPA: hypothetical protein VE985_07265 [Gaiellaceae bacterium]|nr:hypothetical protein [Gaiellaceae bacterium]